MMRILVLHVLVGVQSAIIHPSGIPCACVLKPVDHYSLVSGSVLPISVVVSGPVFRAG